MGDLLSRPLIVYVNVNTDDKTREESRNATRDKSNVLRRVKLVKQVNSLWTCHFLIYFVRNDAKETTKKAEMLSEYEPCLTIAAGMCKYSQMAHPIQRN